ncbi:MAG: heavy metal translocating P-type ATPase [Jatrophihabitans sp.]|nr:MAG: heavy metal translocating P-type ATPase [Jatrophihabitans sp.]
MLALAEVRWAAVAAVLFAAGGIAQLAGAPAPVWWAAYLACYVCGGWEPGLAGLRALGEKTLDVELLMVLAAVVAAVIGQVFDGALLIVIFATSGALEAWATHRTAASVRALLDLSPQQATRLSGVGGEELVATAELAVGDVLLVRPGELIGADALVLGGASEVDQSSITGEPMPVVKQAGDEVFAGTLNGHGALTVQVSRPAGDSVLARIVDLVERASASKAATQLFIEKVEQRYSIGMVTVTLALFVVPLLAGAALQVTLLRAMTFMIVASPCAVVLATMPPLLSAIANAGRHGVLVKSAVVMEQLEQIDLVAFDKTGTLTVGAPRLAAIYPMPGHDSDEVLRLAAAAEHRSEHPIAAAIVTAAHHRDLAIPAAAEFDSAPGRGVTARVDGRLVRVGSPAVLNDTPAAGSVIDGTAALAATLATVQDAGGTAVLVLIDHAPAAVFALADRLRPDARDAVAALGTLTGQPPLLLTGDNTDAARQLGAEVGISDVYAELLPADKVDRVRELQAAGRRVLVVGDGVNDAPALASANLGIAMGRHGSDLALETADAVVVRDELATVPTLIALSRRARRLITANLIIAATVIAALVTWDLAGHLPLPLGVAGHEGSTVIVGLNGLRLLRAAAWRRAGT